MIGFLLPHQLQPILMILGRLLIKLSKIHPEHFKHWYDITIRDDLKVIYIHSVTTIGLDTEDYLFSDNAAKSKILIVKICHIILTYNICSRNGFKALCKKDIKNITEETSLTNQEKLHFILYYFSYSEFNSSKLLIDYFREIFNDLTIDFVDDYFDHTKDDTLYKAISYIKNDKEKCELLEALIKKIKLDTIKSNNSLILDKYISRAKLYGHISAELHNNVDTIENDFNEEVKIIKTPYFIYRKPESWKEVIYKLIYYFIIIYTFYCKESNKAKISFYIDQFKKAKKNFFHNDDEKINEVLNEAKLVLNSF